MHMVVRYYKQKKSLGYLKNKVLCHSVKEELKNKPVLESNSITKTLAMSSKYFHRDCLNGLTHLYIL